MNLKNQLVRFRICDVHIPDPLELAIALHGQELVQGSVIDLSDAGIFQEVYAVIHVEGVERPVIVAVDRLQVEEADEGVDVQHPEGSQNRGNQT